MSSTPDELAAATRDLALAALQEITPASTIGPAAGHVVEADGAVSLRFQNRLPGYPGWFWTVTVAQVEGAEPTVLEVELLPGDGALLAPEWVPWAERLAEYRAHQAELAEQAAAASADAGEGDADALLDAALEADGLDEDDDQEQDILHAGDLDGVDIDELDESGEDDDADEDEADDDESDDADDDESDEDGSDEGDDSDEDDEEDDEPEGDADDEESEDDGEAFPDEEE
ncbi:DUF3027 domain-containing protein [Microbacterium sp. EF45047]|uniref:DUF3027 domain-containing protein n=1 Tax=Microbacterium sp. EF45047 TaxID=2809708 RepID=UPI00234B2C10|nr:DUF3027 domain-containing protein [Microbacterium sp. EF45047]WCM55197.1 DUF3027 domain-containing protein [Microbacterium sp. EF45047]